MSYEAMLAQYQNSQSGSGKSSFNSEENLKNYFTTWIPDSVNEKKKTIRILPPEEGKSPFALVKGHSIQVNGKWNKLLCPKDVDNKPCPFCEARELLRATGDENDKEFAKKYNQKEYFILRVIDREKEEEGVKFWRFNKDYTNQGVFDKIIAIVQDMGPSEDITSVDNGIDLTLDIRRDARKNPVVNGIIPKRVNSKLHEDPEVVKSWLSDTRTWRDVYKAKDYDYLHIILSGETPIWDKESNKYIAKVANDNTNSKAEEKNDVKDLVDDSKNHDFGPEEVVMGKSSVDEDDDDVPF